MKQAYQNLLYLDDRTKASIAARIDEAAIIFHPMVRQRLILASLAALVTTKIAPLWVCGLWLLGLTGLEIWNWFASKKQFVRQYVDPNTRLSFLLSLIIIQIWTVLFALYCINTGLLIGIICGSVGIVTTLVLFSNLFYSTPLVFVLLGALPPLITMFILQKETHLKLDIISSIWIFLGLCLFFVLLIAADTPSTEKTQRKLKEALYKYQILTDNVSDFIGQTDLNGVYQYASASVFTVLGYRPEELIGMRIQDFLDDEPENLEFSGFSEALAAHDAMATVTLSVRHKLGHRVWLQTSTKLVVENGLRVGLISASRDVTDYVTADLALKAAKAEAEEANSAKAAFLANMSHEIRTPMNAVLGALHLLEHEPISPQGRHLIDQALVCGEMLTHIVNDVLDFSKIEAGELSLKPAPMNVVAALEGVIALLAPQADDKAIALTAHVTGEQCWIDADAVRIGQAMFNLVGNGVKFTNKGSVTATISFLPSPRLDHCRVRIEVKDTGIGIPETLRPHIFGRFQQGSCPNPTNRSGTGLGLAISKALIGLMGGDIDFSSVEGQGSCFWMDFEAPRAEPVQAKKFADYELSGVRILLVEDNSTNRLMARTMLASLGAEVIEAENGKVGLEAVIAESFDIVLMDVQMPIMDGICATRAIRALAGPKANIPIIGLTANAMAHQRIEYEQTGMNGIVSKPISPTSLISEVMKHLTHRAL